MSLLPKNVKISVLKSLIFCFKYMKRIKKLAIITVFGLFLIALPVTVWAANNQWSQSVYVAPDQIIEGNFIKAGNIIDIAGSVNGDVIVAGNSITISGPVAGDVIVAGNSVRITGLVGGSVRAVASTIAINSEVTRNVWLVAGTISLGKDSKIGWDVYGAAGSLEIKGPVNRNVLVGSGSVIVGNEVGKDVTVYLDKEGQVVLYPEAKISGNLTYNSASADQLVIKEGAQVLGETKQERLTAKKPGAELGQFLGAAYFLIKIISLFGLLIVGLILITLVPKKVLEIEDQMTKKPWPSVGWGLSYFFVAPAVIILLIFTVIGLPLAMIALPVFLISLYISKIFAGFVIGLFIMNKLSKEKYKGSLVWPLVLGLLVVVIVTSVPLFGWVVKLFLIWWAMGAILVIKKETWKEWR